LSDLIPPRKALLYVVDTSTGKAYPVKATAQSDGTALLYIYLSGEGIGLATESTLSGIKSKIDNISLDDYGRIYVANPPNLDRPLSDILGLGSQTKRTLSDIYSNISSLISSLEDYKLRQLNEKGLRCYSIEIPEKQVFAVPSGSSWYVTEILSTGDLYVDGDVKVV
jgi:hypothetical protein